MENADKNTLFQSGRQNNPINKKVEKVVSGEVHLRKRSEFEKMAESIGTFALRDILIPAFKKMLSDIWHGAGDLIFGRETKGNKFPGSFVSYSNYTDYSKKYGRTEEAEYRRNMNYEEVVLNSRGEAEEVIDHMRDLLQTYKVVSVADYYDLCGVTNFDYNANYYGWSDLRYIEPIRYRNGYMIRLPKAIPIN